MTPPAYTDDTELCTVTTDWLSDTTCPALPARLLGSSRAARAPGPCVGREASMAVIRPPTGYCRDRHHIVRELGTAHRHTQQRQGTGHCRHRHALQRQAKQLVCRQYIIHTVPTRPSSRDSLLYHTDSAGGKKTHILVFCHRKTHFSLYRNHLPLLPSQFPYN